jgi:hypothetical protein
MIASTATLRSYGSHEQPIRHRRRKSMLTTATGRYDDRQGMPISDD